jgi:hypothetical protein
MDSQQVRNLQEAYIGVYEGDLTEEQEFKSWVTGLLDEGYDLSDYTWDKMYEIYNEARDPGVKDYKGGPAFGMTYSTPKPPSGKKGDGSGYGPDEKFKNPDDNIKKPGTTVPKPKPGGYGRIFSNIPHGIGAHANKTASRVTTIIGKDPGAPRSQKMTPKKKNLEIIRKPKNDVGEEVDLYDTILSHLMNEGYADTIEAAEGIMVNMSEEWRESIMEISDERVIAARNALAKRTDNSVGRGDGNQYSKNVSREARMNARIQSRNQRTDSDVEPTFTRRHQ